MKIVWSRTTNNSAYITVEDSDDRYIVYINLSNGGKFRTVDIWKSDDPNEALACAIEHAATCAKNYKPSSCHSD